MAKYRVTRNYKSNHNGRHFGFRKGDETDVDDAVADWVNRDSPGTLEPLGKTGAGKAEPSAGDEVPDKVDDVKAWVGDDPARAAAALEVEQARPKGPRTTLEPWLEEVVAGPADANDEDQATDGESDGDDGDG